MQLDNWQHEILMHRGNILLNTGRQVGKTTIFAHKAGKYMIEHPGARIIVVSLTEDQAQLIIIMTLDYIEKQEKKLKRKIIKPGKASKTKNKIFLINKSQILARPVGNTGDAVRGFTGDVLIVDEASRMPELMWIAAEPTLATTGGEIWMCSTPHGKQGYFYKCYLNEHGFYKVWDVNTWDVYHNREIRDDWTPQRRKKAIEHLERKKTEWSDFRFQQEYMGQFIDDLRQFFPDEVIQKCMTAKRPEIVDKRGIYALGVDVARMGDDESTFEILKRADNGHLQHVENQISKKTILTQTFKHIHQLNSIYDFKKIYIDDEGIGIGVFDMLISEPSTRRKTVALRNSKKIIDYKANLWSKKQKAGKTHMLKQDLYFNLLRLMELRKIILLEDPEIFQSFKSIQYEYTKDKKGKPYMKIFGNYSHIVEGLIRAAWFDKEKHINMRIDWV